MGLLDGLLGPLQRWDWSRRLGEDRRYRLVSGAVWSLILNLAYGFYNGILGVLGGSLLFLVSALYYLLLGAMRFAVVLLEKQEHPRREVLAARITGALLLALSLVYPFVILLSLQENTAAAYGTIPMITMATYTFTKISLAIRSAVKHRKNPSRLLLAVSAIRYTEILVSLLTMQRSMLASFGEAGDKGSLILNACTGGGVCLFILLFGIFTLLISYEERYIMAKSKFIKANEKIAAGVVDGYKKMETGVVDGYKKIESGVVEGYTKIEDAFVARYLTREGETVEEAKQRLKSEEK